MNQAYFKTNDQQLLGFVLGNTKTTDFFIMCRSKLQTRNRKQKKNFLTHFDFGPEIVFVCLENLSQNCLLLFELFIHKVLAREGQVEQKTLSEILSRLTSTTKNKPQINMANRNFMCS